MSQKACSLSFASVVDLVFKIRGKWLIPQISQFLCSTLLHFHTIVTLLIGSLSLGDFCRICHKATIHHWCWNAILMLFFISVSKYFEHLSPDYSFSCTLVIRVSRTSNVRLSPFLVLQTLIQVLSSPLSSTYLDIVNTSRGAVSAFYFLCHIFVFPNCC